MARILSISYDESLLNTRHWILTKAGYAVTSALGFFDAQKACTSGEYDLVVIGHSIPRNDKMELAKRAKTNAATLVISLRKPGSEPISEADFSIDRIDPDALLEIVEAALSRVNKRSASSL